MCMKACKLDKTLNIFFPFPSFSALSNMCGISYLDAPNSKCFKCLYQKLTCMLSHLLLTPLKKQRMPSITFTPGFKSGLRYEQFCITLSSLSAILGWVGGKEKKSPYLVSIGPSKHKNYLTLLHKLLLAPASWIPCPAALCTPGGIKQSTDHLLGSHSPSREQSLLIRMLHLQTPPAQ